jgi:hypothetical protein
MHELVCNWEEQRTVWYYTRETLSDETGRIWRFEVFATAAEPGPEDRPFSAQFHEVRNRGVVLSEGLEAPDTSFKRKGIPQALFELVNRETGLPIYSSTPDERKWWLCFETHSPEARRMWKGLVRRGMAVWYPDIERFRYISPRRGAKGCALLVLALCAVVVVVLLLGRK